MIRVRPAAALFGCTVLALSLPALSADVSARDAALNGVWVLDKPAGKTVLDADGHAPPLLADASKLYQQRRAQLAAGDRAYDLSVKCKPMGFPRVLWDGGPFDIQVQSNLVFFGYTWNRNHRTADFLAALPRVQVPRYYGTSAARWDGDELVVDSAGFSDNTVLDASGLPHGDGLTLSERYRSSQSGTKLQVQLTITDPQYYARPWNVRVNYHKIPGGRILEDVCELHAPLYRGLFPGNN